ncbi:hypothetical protein [Kerstersia gyiorum]|nr:hypothetical protein [Kerstersia gyiorum]MCP1632901.1 hypothetical protein [Kerstersia gyiorum]MCP1635567.1 hypothetical protein [Kerstersia gyiorum]MCP1671027.1 hypothetical protein [Kerstersia gyiorum]MCP1678318.1 hypothetical protein [Kerstersia gyiorum]MCP1682118.1 hypothetical protein [Kerstersia gyiorum]
MSNVSFNKGYGLQVSCRLFPDMSGRFVWFVLIVERIVYFPKLY